VFKAESGINGGVLVDLTPYMEDAAKKDFFPSVMETRIVDEKIYGLPMEAVPLAVFYSIKAFEEARLSESDIPKTWDQFLEIAHKLTKADRFGCLFETSPGYAQTFYWCSFMWQGCGEIVTPDGKHSAFASAATVQALKFWQDAIQQNVAPRNVLGSGSWDVIANLASGFCAMQNLGIWGISYLQELAKDFQYGVFPFPLPPNGRQITSFGGFAFVANARGKNPEEAAKFCVWALGSMQDDSIQRVIDWCTKANSQVSPRKSALEKATTEGGYSSAPMKLFKDVIFPSGRCDERFCQAIERSIRLERQGEVTEANLRRILSETLDGLSVIPASQNGSINGSRPAEALLASEQGLNMFR
jgi:multiple sugar transport system substrate-binding protein